MKRVGLWVCCFIFCCPFLWADEPLWTQVISLPGVKETTYDLLNRISESTGYLFVYDSNLIHNNRKVKVTAGNYSLQQAIRIVAQDDSLQMRLLERHILLYKTTPASKLPLDSTLVMEGIIRDKISREVLPYASVSLSKAGIGTVANSDGKFQLKIPDSLRLESVYVSYMGYESQVLPISLLTGSCSDIYLNVQVVPIPEVIIHLINPQKIINEMLEKRLLNYPDEPVFLTTFYREGIERRKGVVNLTEAVLKVYKRPYRSSLLDQVKLLKMRKIEDESEADSIMLRMKATVEASLFLDLVKNLPDFLTFDALNQYNYTKIDMTAIDSHLAHVIAFEQKQGNEDPLFKGELYIDAENAALLRVRFEFNSEYIHKAKELFIIKQSKDLDIDPKSATYTVSYKKWNGKYYLSYIRGDLQFSIKKKKRLLQRVNTVRSYFEMATCQIDTTNVKPLPGKERISINKIFSETQFSYDPRFWGDFNVILPDESLSDGLSRIAAKIEESIGSNEK